MLDENTSFMWSIMGAFCGQDSGNFWRGLLVGEGGGKLKGKCGGKVWESIKHIIVQDFRLRKH